MPAMRDEVEASMQANLQTLAERMFSLISFDMTHDEALELVAPPEHHRILKEAAHISTLRIVGNDWFNFLVPAEIDGHLAERVQLLMRTHAETEPPLVPRYPQWRPNTAGGAKVIEWMQRRYSLGRRFGIARDVLHKLNKMCDTGTQLRAIWPVVMLLCEPRPNDERLARWADKHAQFKRCAHLPAISPQLKEYIRDSAALLTQATLLGKEDREADMGAVVIATYSPSTYDFMGSSARRL